jgi:hypothetical protein
MLNRSAHLPALALWRTRIRFRGSRPPSLASPFASSLSEAAGQPPVAGFSANQQAQATAKHTASGVVSLEQDGKKLDGELWNR